MKVSYSADLATVLSCIHYYQSIEKDKEICDDFFYILNTWTFIKSNNFTDDNSVILVRTVNMLQKLFRRSFRRSTSKDADRSVSKDCLPASPQKTPSSEQTTSSIQVVATNDKNTSNEKPHDGTHESEDTVKKLNIHEGVTHTEEGINKAAPPVAKVERSPPPNLESCGKKVTFKESVESADVNMIEDETLFGDSVLEAFQVGQLSIADFLKSPHSSPDVERLPKKVRSMSESDMNPPVENKTPPPNASPATKKLSLLDRAHSMAMRKDRKISAPVFQKRVKEEPPNKNGDTENEKIILPVTNGSIPANETNECSKQNNETNTAQCQNRNMESNSTGKQNESVVGANSTVKESPSADEDDKPRFSKSLENLAEEVFGDDFQSYLANASKSPVKFSLTTVKNEVIAPEETIHDISNTNQLRPKSLSPRYNEGVKTLAEDKKCPQTAPVGRKNLLLHSENTKSNLVRAHSTPRQSSRLPRLVKDSEIVHSVDLPRKYSENDSLEKNLESWNNKLDLRSATSLASSETESSQLRMIAEGKVSKAPTKIHADLNTEHRRRTHSTGSAGSHSAVVFSSIPCRQRAKFSKTDSEYVNVGSFSEKDLSASESSVIDICFPPPPPVEEGGVPRFENGEWELISNASPYSSEEAHLDVKSNCDPLIESLLSIVPLPENRQELLPALSKALSEIVSEIIASRRKLNRILKAIEIHQQILKEQSKEIQLQAKQISELRKTAYVLNNYQSVTHRNTENKIRRPQSARTHRQSRDMIELNYTLDKLLHQCSTLQKTPSGEVEQLLKIPVQADERPELRRANTFPTRKLKLEEGTQQ